MYPFSPRQRSILISKLATRGFSSPKARLGYTIRYQQVLTITWRLAEAISSGLDYDTTKFGPISINWEVDRLGACMLCGTLEYGHTISIIKLETELPYCLDVCFNCS